MTVTADHTYDRWTISGNGPYNYEFRIFSESDLTVRAIDEDDGTFTLLTLNTHYSVQDAGEEDGGTITLLGTTATTHAGKILDVRSNVARTQPASFTNSGRFLPETHEAAYDRLCRAVQDLARQVQASLRLADTGTADAVLSPIANWHNKYVYINGDGEPEPAALVSTTVTQSIIGGLLYPQTQRELDAGVTPTSFQYSELDVRRYGASPSSLDNTAAFNQAIAVANETQRCIVVVEAGNYAFSTTSPLTTMSGCLGIIGPSNGAAFLAFNHTDDCLIAKGSYKRFENIYAKNINTTARASRKAVLRVQNCAYGNFYNVYVAGGADDQACFMLEQVYDGSEDDGYLMAHLGCWYNTLINVTAGYLTPGANVGYGIVFHVAASARSVVNPTGQTPGTYTGSISNNTVINPNSESFVHDFFLDGFCNVNTVIGGQMLGGVNSVRVVDSTHNRFIGTALNQPATQPINESGSSARNYYDVFMQRPGVATPWSFGVLSATSEVRHRGDGSVLPQGFFAPVTITDNDSTASQLGTLEIIKHNTYDKNGVVIKTNVEPTGTKALLKIERGAQAISPLQVDVNGDPKLAVTAAGRVVAARELQVPILATASLPAAHADNNGLIVIEDGGAGVGRLVFYKGAQRFKCDGVSF